MGAPGIRRSYRVGGALGGSSPESAYLIKWNTVRFAFTPGTGAWPVQ
jgi:hypothetical protein